MDAVVKQQASAEPRDGRPTRAEVEDAVRTLLRWAGDDPAREGLLDTPKRVAATYLDMFSGYERDPAEELGRTFGETEGYRDMVLVRDIAFHSLCEHHIVPIIGRAHVAYLPNERVVGLSKIARVVDVFARRLQIQERLTMQIAHALEKELRPRGVAVRIDAEHMCMAMRGIRKVGSSTTTFHFSGEFEREELRARFLSAISSERSER